MFNTDVLFTTEGFFLVEKCVELLGQKFLRDKDKGNNANKDYYENLSSDRCINSSTNRSELKSGSDFSFRRSFLTLTECNSIFVETSYWIDNRKWNNFMKNTGKCPSKQMKQLLLIRPVKLLYCVGLISLAVEDEFVLNSLKLISVIIYLFIYFNYFYLILI
jgi:hypothetical protein